MSRIKLLLDVVKDMESLTESLRTLANAIASDKPSTKSEEKLSTQETPEVKTAAKTISVENVKVVLTPISQSSKTTQVKAIASVCRCQWNIQVIRILITVSVNPRAYYRIVGALIDNLPLLINAAIELVTALVEGIGIALPQLIPAAISTVTKIVQGLINNLPML